ncbi:hypothetical protein KY290_031841 [Solanum tuberosum]|uniref:DUF4283 domain-containing protein n=1 Tax=Solanum tuberosum TaxID=4113 RepID=A0ABQ7UAG8_SOLTU|nr:hypothetical protein KY289_031247 [Solanum tuberosum]KAH0743848.1 hypothetical protein KY290_031841 [Solanum tuberosum]
MEWICFVLKEASNDNKNLVKRWRMKDQMAEYFNTRKFNAHGRFMSLLSLKRADKAVVILPKAFSAGWKDIYIPLKFQKAKGKRFSTTATIEYGGGLLGRCIRGNIGNLSSEMPTFSEVRKWASRNMAEQTLQGGWTWKKPRVWLEWCNPIAGYTPVAQKSKMSWIRAIGPPLHLWSHEIFRHIGDLCGGWIYLAYLMLSLFPIPPRVIQWLDKVRRSFLSKGIRIKELFT